MYRKILVPIDGSTTSAHGLNEAIELAKVCGATIRLLHVIDEAVLSPGYLPLGNYGKLLEGLREKGRKILADAEALVRREGVRCEGHLIDIFRDQAAKWILEESRQCDLIVMGTHGRRGLVRLVLGSDAEIVLREARVPVLLVRHNPD